MFVGMDLILSRPDSANLSKTATHLCSRPLAGMFTPLSFQLYHCYEEFDFSEILPLMSFDQALSNFALVLL